LSITFSKLIPDRLSFDSARSYVPRVIIGSVSDLLLLDSRDGWITPPALAAASLP